MNEPTRPALRWRWPLAAVAVLLAAALVVAALAGRSFFGPGVPTSTPKPSASQLIGTFPTGA